MQPPSRQGVLKTPKINKNRDHPSPPPNVGHGSAPLVTRLPTSGAGKEKEVIDMVNRQLMSNPNANKTVPKSEDEAKNRNYQFWSTQPVPKFDDKPEVSEVSPDI